MPGCRVDPVGGCLSEREGGHESKRQTCEDDVGPRHFYFLCSSSALSTHMTKNGCLPFRFFMTIRNGRLKLKKVAEGFISCLNSDRSSAPLRSSRIRIVCIATAL